MASNGSTQPPGSRPSSMLARLRGMVQPTKPEEPLEPPPAEPVESADGVANAPPVFEVPSEEEATVATIPMNQLPFAQSLHESLTESMQAPPEEIAAPGVPMAEPVEAAPVAPAAPAAPANCPFCGAPRVGNNTYCGDCGLIYPPAGAPAAASATTAPSGSPGALNNRYELGQQIGVRGSIERFRGTDRETGAAVVILRGPQAEAVPELTLDEVTEEAEPEPVPDAMDTGDEIMPSFDFPDPSATAPDAQAVSGAAVTAWPSVAWERDLLMQAQHPALPKILDTFTEGGCDYLVEEVPTGEVLWNAWDDPSATAAKRFGLLKQVAEALQALHQADAILEGLRPDIVTVTDDGRAVISDLSDLLPLPLPANTPLRATHYTAPELILTPEKADARADLYSFGGMLYALHVGRELTEMDFERSGSPKPFMPRFPDCHPLFCRLVCKTFCRVPEGRFPSDEASKEDATGFTELIKTLEVCGRTFDLVRLEISAWTTTGMVRTGNEDAFAFLHSVEGRQDDVGEYAILLLADGMGGYEAGEVAAALSLQEMRKYVLQQPIFSALAGQPAELPVPKRELQDLKQHMLEALKAANRFVFTHSRTPGKGKRGMGCTSEAVYVDGRCVVVGHVGDSRTYHLHQGQMVQLTRDQTLVNRLVELGQITAEEAEGHPRRSELQQAIGGQPDCVPGLYTGELKVGDWVVVCSDGLSNHVTSAELTEMLQSVSSAEQAARQLINLVNLKGATDNATVVVVRAL
jgi:protein phosphatase